MKPLVRWATDARADLFEALGKHRCCLPAPCRNIYGKIKALKVCKLVDVLVQIGWVCGSKRGISCCLQGQRDLRKKNITMPLIESEHQRAFRT